MHPRRHGAHGLVGRGVVPAGVPPAGLARDLLLRHLLLLLGERGPLVLRECPDDGGGREELFLVPRQRPEVLDDVGLVGPPVPRGGGCAAGSRRQPRRVVERRLHVLVCGAGLRGGVVRQQSHPIRDGVEEWRGLIGHLAPQLQQAHEQLLARHADGHRVLGLGRRTQDGSEHGERLGGAGRVLDVLGIDLAPDAVDLATSEGVAGRELRQAHGDHHVGFGDSAGVR